MVIRLFIRVFAVYDLVQNLKCSFKMKPKYDNGYPLILKDHFTPENTSF